MSTSTGPAGLASEKGGTVVTVHGTGFDPLDIDWVDVGSASDWSSQVTTYAFVSGNLIQFVAPAEPLTVGPQSMALTVSTLGGQSPSAGITYAGVPHVSAVVNSVDQRTLDGTYGAPDTGSTPIRIFGTGFAGQVVGPVEFADTKAGSYGTQYSFTIEGDQTVRTETVQQTPGLVDVELCTVTACSLDPPSDLLYLFPPGNPNVTSVHPDKGPAAGGTKVVIGGNNLDCPLYAFFGTVESGSLSAMKGVHDGGLDCTSTTTVEATSPPGRAGTSVPVRVMTVEGYFAGAGRVPPRPPSRIPDIPGWGGTGRETREAGHGVLGHPSARPLGIVVTHHSPVTGPVEKSHAQSCRHRELGVVPTTWVVP